MNPDLTEEQAAHLAAHVAGKVPLLEGEPWPAPPEQPQGGVTSNKRPAGIEIGDGQGVEAEGYNGQPAAVEGWKPTHAEVVAWNERNGGWFQGRIDEARCAIDDARSIHLLSAAPTPPSAPVQQGVRDVLSKAGLGAAVTNLLRFFETTEDDESTDLQRWELDRLVAIGWLEKIGREWWRMTDAGRAVISSPSASPAGDKVEEVTEQNKQYDESGGESGWVIAGLKKRIAELEAEQNKQSGEVVVWRCKDYADGWIYFPKESQAVRYKDQTGCLMQALYTSQSTATQAAVAAAYMRAAAMLRAQISRSDMDSPAEEATYEILDIAARQIHALIPTEATAALREFIQNAVRESSRYNWEAIHDADEYINLIYEIVDRILAEKGLK